MSREDDKLPGGEEEVKTKDKDLVGVCSLKSFVSLGPITRWVGFAGVPPNLILSVNTTRIYMILHCLALIVFFHTGTDIN